MTCSPSVTADGDFSSANVEGHGAAAAAVTSLSRYTLRAAALHDADPAAVLGQLNTTLRLDRDTQKCVTVLFGVLTAHPAGGAMITLGNGGHQRCSRAPRRHRGGR